MDFPGFCGPAYEARSVKASAQRCVNYYLEADPEKGNVLYPTPGLIEWAQLDTAGSVLATETYGDSIIAVANGKVWRYRLGIPAVQIGSITPGDDAYIAVAGDRAIVVSGGAALGINLGDWTAFIPSLPFTPGTVTSLNGYFVASEVGTQRWYYSAPFDPSSWAALDFYSKEGAPDPLVCVLADYRELFLIGQRTTEVWTNTGGVDGPFDRIQGAFIEHGTASRASVAKMDGSIYMVGSNDKGEGMIWRIQGYQPQVISTPAIGAEIETYPRIDDSYGFCYQQAGHAYYVVTFPSAGKTWVYDITTQAWHERAYLNASGQLEHHLARCHALLSGQHFVGLRDRATLAAWKLDFYTDLGREIVRIRSAPHVFAQNRNNYVQRFEAYFDTGNAPLNVSPVVGLRVSKDGGRTWGNQRTVSLGLTGQYRTRCYWHRHGKMRDGVFEVTVTDNTFAPIVGASIDFETGTS
jgi:hypothetical protein